MDSLRSFRSETGLSQKELAGLLGISRNFLAQVETGRSALPTNTLVRFSQLKQIWTNLANTKEAVEGEPFLNPERKKKDAARILTLNKEIARLEKEIREAEQQLINTGKGRLFCKELKVRDWAGDNIDIQTALDLIQIRHGISLTENGPKQLARLQFYLKQKLDEKAFLEGH